MILTNINILLKLGSAKLTKLTLGSVTIYCMAILFNDEKSQIVTKLHIKGTANLKMY